ncbi:MAG TPA: RNA-binding protein [Hyphomicrobiaceae bacterium]
MAADGNRQDARRAADQAGPMRLCVLTRAQKPIEELLRFVCDPEGRLVPDLALRLPGRGAWVSARRSDVSAAIERKVFARSLKCAVAVPPDLPARIEELLGRRLVEAVSLANKAGLLVAGFAKVEDLIRGGRAVLLLHASDASQEGAGKLDRLFKALAGPETASLEIVRELGSAELSLAIGRSNVVHAAASAGGASRRIVQEAERLRRYRTGEE